MIDQSSISAIHDHNSTLDMDIDSIYADDPIPEAMDVMVNNPDSDSDSMDSVDDEPTLQAQSMSGERNIYSLLYSKAN